MTNLNDNLDIILTNKEENTADVFDAATSSIPLNKPSHLFDDSQKKEQKTTTDNTTKKTNEKTSNQNNKQQSNPKSKNTFFTIPIIILMVVILILVVVIIVIIRFKTKNTDILLEQSKEHLEELVKKIDRLEEENKILKQSNSKLQHNLETFKSENKQLINEISLAKRDNFEIQQQRSKTHSELKAEKFNISNNYIEKNINKNTEQIVDLPQESINMTKEINSTNQKNDDTTEEDSDIESLLNN